jgi:hypothetical protein
MAPGNVAHHSPGCRQVTSGIPRSAWALDVGRNGGIGWGIPEICECLAPGNPPHPFRWAAPGVASPSRLAAQRNRSNDAQAAEIAARGHSGPGRTTRGASNGHCFVRHSGISASSLIGIRFRAFAHDRRPSGRNWLPTGAAASPNAAHLAGLLDTIPLEQLPQTHRL